MIKCPGTTHPVCVGCLRFRRPEINYYDHSVWVSRTPINLSTGHCPEKQTLTVTYRANL